jgi:hypothetical protein
MKPSLAKPTSIIAQVEGSGTAPPMAKTPLPSIVRSIGPEMKPRLIRLLSPAFLEGTSAPLTMMRNWAPGFSIEKPY